VVDSEIIECLPGVHGGGAAEPRGLIFEPDVREGHGGESLVVLVLSEGFVSQELQLVLLDEGSIEEAGLKSLIEEDSLHELDVSWQANDLVVVEGCVESFTCFISVFAPYYQL
jgi:hypothetical protein